MSFLSRTRVVVQGATATVNAATGNKLTFAPTTPVVITRWGFIATTALDTGTITAALDFRPTVGSDTNRVDGATADGIDTAGGAMTATAAQLAVGKGVYHNVKQAATGLLGGAMEVVPGQEVVIDLTAETVGAGSLIPFIEYTMLPFQQGTPATTGSAGTNQLVNMTSL